MRFQAIMIPGGRDCGPGHWQRLWAQALPHALFVEPVRRNADPARWTAALSAAVGDTRGPAILVAHGLGCLAAVRLPLALRARVAGALLVAPVDVERSTAASLRAFGPIPQSALPYQSVVVASDNDPACTLARAAGFATDWGSRFVALEGAGRIDESSGHGAWPQGLKLLSALRRRAAWRITPPAPRIAPIARPNPA